MRIINQITWAAAAASFVLACSSSNQGNGGGTTGGGTTVGLPQAPGGTSPTQIGPAGTGAPGMQNTGQVPPAGTGTLMGQGGMTGVAGAPTVATGGTAAPGTGGAAATMPMGGTTDPTMCPAAPAGASMEATAALAAINAARVPAGSGCDNLILTLDMSALNHCNYYAMNKSNAMCVANAHLEVMSCMGFTGADPGTRMMAAGYTSRGGGSEVMAFVDNPASSVAQWINTVFHRIPILDPWTVEMGYGNATGCDTIDFGKGTPTTPTSAIVVYPYNGQTNVPTTFDGSHEGPMPPAPSTGWPSSSPVNIYAQGLTVTDHVITLDSDTTPIDHVWLDATNNTDTSIASFLRSTAFLYANKPFAANTKYHVRMAGMHTGGAFNLEWTFTTGATNRF
ncbi:MAG: CAP domain-containing protein [Polyangiales bacterium]